MPKLIGPYLLECWDIFSHLSLVYKVLENRTTFGAITIHLTCTHLHMQCKYTHVRQTHAHTGLSNLESNLAAAERMCFFGFYTIMQKNDLSHFGRTVA